MTQVLILLLSVVTGSCGQIFFKKGMLALGKPELSLKFDVILSFIGKICTQPLVVTGMLFYFFSTVIWLYSLSRVPLNRAYPYTAINFVLVILASYFLFSETIPFNRFLGVGIIVCGVLVASFK